MPQSEHAICWSLEPGIIVNEGPVLPRSMEFMQRLCILPRARNGTNIEGLRRLATGILSRSPQLPDPKGTIGGTIRRARTKTPNYPDAVLSPRLNRGAPSPIDSRSRINARFG